MSISRRRAIIGAQSKSRLPSEYQEVEYIESTGSQFFDINYQFTSNNFRLLSKTNTNVVGEQCIFGNDAVPFENGYRASGIEMFSYSGTSIAIEIGDYRNKIIEFEVEQKNGVRYIKAEGIVSQSNNVVNLVGKSLFAGSFRAYANYAVIAKIYNYRIYDNDILVRNFIPCYRKSDDKPGLYDLASNTFFTNANTSSATDFIVGPDVN